MASRTSFCCARNASPSFWVKSSFSLIAARTSGKFTRDFTLGSQFWASRAVVSASPFKVLFALAQRSACTTSRGYVDAIRICEINSSGYNAMGATNCSISPGWNTVPVPWAPVPWALRRTGHGQTRSTARSQTRNVLQLCFMRMPPHLLDSSPAAHATLRQQDKQPTLRDVEQECSATASRQPLDHSPSGMGPRSNSSGSPFDVSSSHNEQLVYVVAPKIVPRVEIRTRDVCPFSSV